MDGVATPQAEPPCRGGRNPMSRTKTAASVAGCSICVGEGLCYFIFEGRLLNFVLLHFILFVL